MTTTLEIASTRAEETADLDRILGDHALFMLNEACRKLRVSMPSIYRAMRLGRVPYVMNGNRRALYAACDEAPTARRSRTARRQVSLTQERRPWQAALRVPQRTAMSLGGRRGREFSRTQAL